MEIAVLSAKQPRMLQGRNAMTISIKGNEMVYQDMGSGPAVIMVQGKPEETEYWLAQSRALVDKGFRVVIVSSISHIRMSGSLFGLMNYLVSLRHQDKPNDADL